MSPQRIPLFALLAVAPFGITSSLYTASAGYMAGALGLSADEASWLNLVYTAVQLAALPLAAWWSHRYGTYRLLAAGALSGLGGSLLAGFSLVASLHFIAWIALGIAASAMLIGAQMLVLQELPRQQIIYTQGGILLLSSLLSAGAYPWLIGLLAEAGLWQLPFAALLLCYTLLLGGLWLVPQVVRSEQGSQITFNLPQAALVTLLLGALTWLLQRSHINNGFDSPQIVELALVTGVLLLLCVCALRWHWGSGEYLRGDVLHSNRNKVAMYNAALAGFAALGTTILIGSYLTSVLKYSYSQQGWVQLPGFASMLLGLAIGLLIASRPKGKIEAVIPFGVLLILLSSVMLSNSGVASGQADLLPALLLRGLGIGLLNTAITLTILLSFERQHLPQGVSYFYLARTLGGLVGSALFARLLNVESASTLSVLGEHINPLNPAFIERQQALGQLLQQGGLALAPERVAALLGRQLQTQAAAIVGINNFQWFVLCLCLLGPLLVIAKIWASRTG